MRINAQYEHSKRGPKPLGNRNTNFREGPTAQAQASRPRRSKARRSRRSQRRRQGSEEPWSSLDPRRPDKPRTILRPSRHGESARGDKTGRDFREVRPGNVHPIGEAVRIFDLTEQRFDHDRAGYSPKPRHERQAPRAAIRERKAALSRWNEAEASEIGRRVDMGNP